MAVFLQTEIKGLEGGDRASWAGQAAGGPLTPRERGRISRVFGEGAEVRELEHQFFPEPQGGGLRTGVGTDPITPGLMGPGGAS